MIAKDDDGKTIASGDYFSFAFGIPPIGVICVVSQGQRGLSYTCLYPADVKPKSGSLADLMKYYQVWKMTKIEAQTRLRSLGAML